jgi:hypothetical protein
MMIEVQAAYFVLKSWKRNSAATKRQIGTWQHWKQETEDNDRSSVKQLRTTQPFGLSRSWRTLARHSGAILEVADTLYTSINVVTQNPVQGLLAECY